MSICGWMKYNSFNYWSRLISLGNGVKNDNILVANREGTNDCAFHIYREHQNRVLESDNFFELNEWVFICAVVTNSGTMKLYKNGILKAYSNGWVPDSLIRTRQYIGRSNWFSDDYYNGEIDDVRIYNRALSELEIELLYHENSWDS